MRGARDLTRALEDARDDLSRSKQRLSKFLLRHGLVFDERTAHRPQEGQLDPGALVLDRVD